MTSHAFAPSLRLALAGAVLVLATGCRSNSCCAPASRLADVPCPSACAPPPAYVPPAYVAPAPRVVASTPAPACDPETVARLQTQEQTIQRLRELNEVQRQQLELETARAAAPAPALVGTPGGGLAASDGSAERFAEELKASNLRGARLLVEDKRVVVILTDSFDSGSDRLKPNPDVHAALLAVGSTLPRFPSARVDVVGHTDGQPLQRTRGKWGDNATLSRARADSVAKALSSAGVAADRMHVDGRGEREPLVAPEKTAADRARNRRVEIQVVFPG